MKPPAAPIKPKAAGATSGKGGKSVTIEDSIEREEFPALLREKSMTEIKSGHRPELKREKSAPEFRDSPRARGSIQKVNVAWLRAISARRVLRSTSEPRRL